MDPEKIKEIQKILVPRRVKKIRRFLGMAGYYSQFIFRLARIWHRCAEISKKWTFDWDKENNEAGVRAHEKSLDNPKGVSYP